MKKRTSQIGLIYRRDVKGKDRALPVYYISEFLKSERGSRVIAIKKEIKIKIKEDLDSKIIVIKDNKIQVPKSSKESIDYINTSLDIVTTNTYYSEDRSSITQDIISVLNIDSHMISNINLNTLSEGVEVN